MSGGTPYRSSGCTANDFKHYQGITALEALMQGAPDDWHGNPKAFWEAIEVELSGSHWAVNVDLLYFARHRILPSNWTKLRGLLQDRIVRLQHMVDGFSEPKS